ncbi:MAG TPA: GAF domain-containing protein, partial [Vicinamibacteria bacterium]|nr:GAF domain-containing protein [Vicinamibacteria bacterium]
MTSELRTILLAQSLGQAVLALALALILESFHRAFGRGYLRDWALSWLALAVYIAGALAGMRHLGEPWPIRPALHAVTYGASYLQVAWLVLGTLGLAREAPPSRRLARLVVAAAVAAGLLTVPFAIGGSRNLALGGIRCLVAGLAYLATATLVLGRAAGTITIGRRFGRVALTLYALDQFTYAGLALLLLPQMERFLPLLAVLDFVATALIGVALVTWLLEGERQRQRRAGELAARRRRAQECVYRISEATRTVRDLPALFRSIHDSLRGVVPSRNFYIALFDRGSGLLSFPYFADEKDPTPSSKLLGRGLTEYVLRTGQPLLAPPEVFRSLRAAGEVELIASDSIDWLGAPLFGQGQVIGVAAIQTYDETSRISPEDRDLFVMVSEQIASA